MIYSANLSGPSENLTPSVIYLYL